jgi:hypothetical protein
MELTEMQSLPTGAVALILHNNQNKNTKNKIKSPSKLTIRVTTSKNTKEKVKILPNCIDSARSAQATQQPLSDRKQRIRETCN